MKSTINLFSIIIILLFSCGFGDKNNKNLRYELNPGQVDTMEKPSTINYAWISKSEYKNSESIVNQIPVPKGYKRVETKNGSFAEWLRYLALNPENTKVLLFDGREKPYQTGAYRIINIDIGNADLQQCADAIMRLKAEYHYSKGEFDKIHFNFSSGHKVSFDDWRKGRKPVISGNTVSFSSFNGKTDNSYNNFKKYLKTIFSYAGTASLEKELLTRNPIEISAGDLFIKGGFPGHAVIVMDVAENIKNGDRIFLLAQSYMPAQSIHILKNLHHNTNFSPWYPANFGETLHTPEWDFKKVALKKWK
jgi:hypothetical protein